MIEKVTCLITRPTPAGGDLLLFEHPFAGNQIPAGTIEPGEPIDQAALREAREETGLSNFRIRQYLGSQDHTFPDNVRLVQQRTPVYARPDTTSLDVAVLGRCTTVDLLRQQDGFSQVQVKEMDSLLNPTYVTWSILGWVPDAALCRPSLRRHFYLLETDDPTPERWSLQIDYHTFSPFWAPLHALPPIIPPQDQWLRFLPLTSESHSTD
jgi:8-oxo-dGTP pyrophosphatase MutT (NUDIX family)